MPPPTTTHHQPKYPPPTTTIHNHPLPAKIHPPTPTNSENTSTTTNCNPKYIQVRRCSNVVIFIKIKWWKTLYKYFPQFFIRNPFIRISSHCLTATQKTWLADLQLLRNFFLHDPLHYFYYIHKKWFKIL